MRNTLLTRFVVNMTNSGQHPQHELDYASCDASLSDHNRLTAISMSLLEFYHKWINTDSHVALRTSTSIDSRETWNINWRAHLMKSLLRDHKFHQVTTQEMRSQCWSAILLCPNSNCHTGERKENRNQFETQRIEIEVSPNLIRLTKHHRWTSPIKWIAENEALR